MYLHQRTPVLEQPSAASRTFSGKKLDATTHFCETDSKRLTHMKLSAGVEIEQKVIKKKFKKKQPNPLSCKKKKSKGVPASTKKINEVADKTIKKRTKIKIPKYVKEHLNKMAA